MGETITIEISVCEEQLDIHVTYPAGFSKKDSALGLEIERAIKDCFAEYHNKKSKGIQKVIDI